uniref:Uncharacterized protein n=1 Tax=Strombidinopsis acuminata TaxID=141414 RepID=A0A7S3SC20_9SPIT|mmetsp:Transcript_2748/g.3592  ORF Transcript_2748/g.3592 Transcript_2748/m.3592 type:complete len:162 (+) Transcript_2748:46-531(+)
MIAWKKDQKILDLNDKTNMDAWRQRLSHEDREVRKQTIADLEKMKEQLEQKNSYINQFKKKTAVEEEEREKQTKQNFLYDKVQDQEEEEEKNAKAEQYCKKCKYESKWCKHRKLRDDAHQKQDAIVTTAQGLGWREPYDNLTFGNNRTAICKRSFFDPGHL